MHRIDTPTAQTDKFGAGKNGFTRGNPQTGVPATALDDDYFDTIQEEIARVIESTGVVLNKNNRAQLLAAINTIIANGGDGFLKKANNLSDLGDVQTALKNLTLAGIGIGLPNMSDIANFDWQNFVFTSGANYVTSYNTWVNPPAGITYNAGTRVSIRVIYISTTNGPRMGLELTPDTGSSTNFKVYKLLCVGAAGSRVFTFNQDWNSANPVPISGGGTGATTAAGALTNLGLGEGSLVPIGIPLPYPLATAPIGFLKCNGSSFSTATYPKLALMYPSGVLPDLRGEFVRGWDDGRGVNPGRALLTLELDAFQGHFHEQWGVANQGQNTGLADTVKNPSNLLSSDSVRKPTTDGTNGTPRTASETRPRSIAFNYIVRAI
jgi:hypothetical protein